MPSTGVRFQSTFPRGERRKDNANGKILFGFNPRSHEGNDVISSILTDSDFLFQSTFPRGERHVSHSMSFVDLMFQSTFPRGERLYRWYKDAEKEMFQSTFPRGERLYALRYWNELPKFQSTFPRGERLEYWADCGEITQVSIHVPTRGTTTIDGAGHRHYRGFQSTFPRGERQNG